MERIVLEVDDATAKKWQIASSKFKKVISQKFAADVDFVIETYKDENFFEALDELGIDLLNEVLLKK